MSNQKILITGASGFIGSFLVDRALDKGFDVYAAIHPTSSRKRLTDTRIKILLFDLLDPGSIDEKVAEFAEKNGSFDYVIHTAAITRPPHMEMFYTGNSEFTKHFAYAIKTHMPGLKKFIYISSIAALGIGNSFDPLTDGLPENPFTPYGKSKLKAERYLSEINGFPFLAFRPVAVYGPRDRKFMVRIMKLFKRGWEVRIGGKNQKLSFIYVKDLVTLLFDATESELVGEIYNVSNGGITNQKEFNALVKKYLGVTTTSVYIPKWVLMSTSNLMLFIFSLMGRPLHLTPHKVKELTAKNWEVDISRLNEHFDFKPKYSFEEGIEETIDWFRKRGFTE